MSRRTEAMLVVLAALSVLAAALSYHYMATACSKATSAADDLAGCYLLAPQIEAFGRLPALATDQEKVSSETTSLIEDAAKASGIPAKSLLRINPEPAQRLGDTVYKEKPTQVLLKDVTMRQVVEMLYRLASSEQGLSARSLRLAAPQEDDPGPNWAAEVTVSYLIYEPIRVLESGSVK